MRCLDKPIVDYGDVYDACASGIDDAVMAARFNTARADVIAAFKNYELLGSSHQLYMSVASAWGNNTQLVLADITKKEFVDLYSDQMVGNNKPGRNHYDRLMMLAPLGKCPFCGFGQAKTLDHFLSKACYPAFSVLCVNLVPVCTDCNKGKVASVLTQNNQILHPYFEDKIVETVTWLFAEVIESGSVSVRYIVQPPDTMSADLRQRIANYFKDLKLAGRFAIEATSELADLADLLDELGTQDLRKDHLSRVARIERRNRTNSWKAALYEALAGNAWYQMEGYRKQGS